MSIRTEKAIKSLPMVPLRGAVAFPGNIFHFEAGRKKTIIALNQAMENGQTIFLLAQKDEDAEEPVLPGDFYRTGVVARVLQLIRVSKDSIRVITECLYRAKIVEIEQQDPYFLVQVVRRPVRRIADDLQNQALIRMALDRFVRYSHETGIAENDAFHQIRTSKDPNQVADYIAGNVTMEPQRAQQLLEQPMADARLEELIAFLDGELELLRTEAEIEDKVKQNIDRNQREYYLREQMHVIADELGEDESPMEESDNYRAAINALAMPEESKQKLLKECAKLSKMPSGSHEATVVRGYLDTCIELPWGKFTTDRIDLAQAQKILDRDHYGLKKVKERILELLAVRKLHPDVKGQILCLVGPPGVGKTSIARSIAKAMNRQYVRVSLGGVHDEAEIRGHRRTYIGSMPGRIISAIKQAGSANPLLLLDEIDKLSDSYQGDPASALLEVLDAEQNFSFQDHFIDLPFDLSKVLFVTTANDESAIPRPLLDRMELIHISSYTHDEKFHIAKEHLYPEELAKNGLDKRRMKITDDAFHALIDGYTREAGVRGLDRVLASLCRKSARKIVGDGEKSVKIEATMLEELLGPAKFKDDDITRKNEVGVTNGLAWTSVGGEVMQIEVTLMEGTGKLELTGSLGDVMKESARIAVSCVRTYARAWGVDPEFYKKYDLHIHVPEGAVPKDGPSAGITLTTALVSALRDIPVRSDVAMTGEVTLRGRVLPIGGLREKAMGAYRKGIRTVIIPKGNEPDLAEVDDIVKENVQFIPAETVQTVFAAALCAPLSSDKTAEKKEKDGLNVQYPGFISPEHPMHAE